MNWKFRGVIVINMFYWLLIVNLIILNWQMLCRTRDSLRDSLRMVIKCWNHTVICQMSLDEHEGSMCAHVTSNSDRETDSLIPWK